jgi:hypothetical protein
LQFALDVTGGRDVVYRVAVYLQELVRQLSVAPGLLNRARIDLLLFDAQTAQVVTPDRLLEGASAMAATGTGGARFSPVYRQLKQLPFEGGGFHTFLLLTRNPAEGWAGDVTVLQGYVASVTGLICGPDCAPDVAMALSKEPGGTRVVNPLDTIRRQFDAIGAWLIENFADPEPLPQTIPLAHPLAGYAAYGARVTPAAVASEAKETPPLEEPPIPLPPAGAKWRVLEPQDRTDAVPHFAAEHHAGVGGWQMAGASRRGKLHAHEGLWRDDAFSLGLFQGWHLIAVADGAGSCRLSRVGARIATAAAIQGMQLHLKPSWSGETEEATLAALQQVICAGIEEAQTAVYTEAGRREIPVRDLSSTLLLLAFGPVPSGQQFMAVGQIGDGMVLAVNPPDGALQVLGAADKGHFAGETMFLPALPSEAWPQHAWAMALTTLPELVLVMTDGVADDLIPLQRQAPTLINGVRAAVPQRHPEQALLEMLNYDKRDSADDRTLAVLYRQS